MLQRHLLCAITACAALPAMAAGPATVSGVPEGDRLLVTRDGAVQEVRVYAVDCPEAGQAQAGAARDFTARHVLNRTVTLEERATDAAGMPVADVRLEDGTSLGEALAGEGLAWWDEANAPGAKEVRKAHASAIGAGKGIFADAAALAPWDYRKSHGLPAVSYAAAAPAPPPAPKAEEPKVLSASGAGQYEDPAPRVYDVGKMNLKVDGNMDYMSLMAKHQPRIATDPSGKPLGVTADAIADIPFAQEFGLQNGDIITSVNGMAINDMGSIMGMVDQLKGSKRLDVVVTRAGRPVPITVTLP